MRHTTIAAAIAAALLLTACTDSSGDKAAKPSAPASTTIAPTTEEPATPTEDAAADALKEADEEFERALADAKNALGETIGVQEGTYEVTNSQPEYEDVSLALDDEYIAPGTYTTKGLADQASGCYWARMRDTSGQSGSIIANDLTTGRAIVELAEGEFFKTSGCKPWTHSGD